MNGAAAKMGRCYVGTTRFRPAAAPRGGSLQRMRAMSPFFEHLARIATWFCVALLTLLSLLPAAEMVRTGYNGDLEHFVAYAGTGAMAAIGFRRVHAWRLAVALVIVAGLLELGQ